MISPFKLSQDVQIKRNKQRSENFFKEYKELCKKHGLEHRAELHAMPTSLLAILTLVDYKEKDERNSEG